MSRVTASRARTDFSRPTKSGTIICGKTTMSRRGRTAIVSTVFVLASSARAAVFSLDAAVFLFFSVMES
ncbi:hypothetical protein [Asaia krungthepensis]|uniref:hypothetical protein n=1 Tax=Asaia krungthepensis TaxID=220990 RepID=UPI003570CC46